MSVTDSKCYFWNDENGWSFGKVQAFDGKVYTCKNEKNELCKVYGEDNIYIVTEKLPEIEDLTQIKNLHYAAIQAGVQSIAKKNVGEGYVTLGLRTALYVNSFDSAAWDAVSEQYIGEGKPVRNKVHPGCEYSNVMYHNVMRTRKPSSLVLIGDVSSGKTWNFFHCTRFLWRSGKCREDTIAKLEGLLSSLDFFTSCKTTKSKSSSKCTKLAKIMFRDNGQMCGTSLELVSFVPRITTNGNERLYHPFYMVSIFGRKAEEFRFLGKVEIDEGERERAEAIHSFLTAFLGEGIWNILHAILELMNLTFQESNKTPKIVSKAPLEKAAQLLQVNSEDLEKELLSDTEDDNGTLVSHPLPVLECEKHRGHLCEMLYAGIVAQLLHSFNAILPAVETPHAITMTIVDPVGFENFKVNTTEQLRNNIVSDALKHMMFKRRLLDEIEDAKSEGLEVKPVKFTDDKLVNEFILGQDGLLDSLEKELSNKSATDATITNEIDKKFLKNPAYERPKGAKLTIGIKYSSTKSAFYSFDGFVAQNNRRIKPALLRLLRDSGANLKFPAEVVGAPFVSKVKHDLEKITLCLSNIYWLVCLRSNPMCKQKTIAGGDICEQLMGYNVLPLLAWDKQALPVVMPIESFRERYGILENGEGTAQEQCAKIARSAQKQSSGLSFHVSDTSISMKVHQYIALEDARCKKLSSHIEIVQMFVRSRNSYNYSQSLIHHRSITRIQQAIRGLLAEVEVQELEFETNRDEIIQNAIEMYMVYSEWQKLSKCIAEEEKLQFSVLCNHMERMYNHQYDKEERVREEYERQQKIKEEMQRKIREREEMHLKKELEKQKQLYEKHVERERRREERLIELEAARRERERFEREFKRMSLDKDKKFAQSCSEIRNEIIERETAKIRSIDWETEQTVRITLERERQKIEQIAHVRDEQLRKNLEKKRKIIEKDVKCEVLKVKLKQRLDKSRKQNREKFEEHQLRAEYRRNEARKLSEERQHLLRVELDHEHLLAAEKRAKLVEAKEKIRLVRHYEELQRSELKQSNIKYEKFLEEMRLKESKKLLNKARQRLAWQQRSEGASQWNIFNNVEKIDRLKAKVGAKTQQHMFDIEHKLFTEHQEKLRSTKRRSHSAPHFSTPVSPPAPSPVLNIDERFSLDRTSESNCSNSIAPPPYESVCGPKKPTPKIDSNMYARLLGNAPFVKYGFINKKEEGAPPPAPLIVSKLAWK